MKNISKTPRLSKSNYLKNKIFNIVKNENPGVNTLKSLKAFTLVELIIVITILAILSTMGFVSFQSYTINTRDANRLTTISNIQKGLSLYQAKNIKLPNPDDSTTIYASGVIIGYEGIVGDTISSLIGISKTPLDPIRSENYIYYTNVNKDKSQVMGFMEGDEYKTLSFLNNKITYAGKDDRNPRVEGDKLGIILDSNKQRVTGIGVDLLLTNSSSLYTSYFDNSDILTSSGKDLFSKVYNRRSDLLTNTTYANLDDSLVGYWDMETTTLSGSQVVLKDLSKYGNNGNCYNSGTLVNCGTIGQGPQFVSGNGTTGKAMSFDGIDDYIRIIDNSSLNPNNITILINFKIKVSGKQMSFSSKGWNSHRIILGSGKAYNYYQRDSSGNNTYVDGKSLLNTNINYNIITTFNGLKQKIYLNSQLDGEINISGNITNNLGSDMFIGSYGTLSDFLNGTIDEVRIYNRALSDSEIQELYNSTK